MKAQIKDIAVKTLTDELHELEGLKSFIDEKFVEVVELVLASSGRVVFTGIGKSAIIAQKIVATLNSTGTPSIFMHAADAIHGDLGIIQKDDIVFAISKSGNTPEVKVLVPILKQFGNKLVAIVGNIDSYLAQAADYIINTTVSREACPNNLAPTTSTTAQLMMGDALAVALLSCRNFKSDDFSKYHPGGALGKKLYLTAGDLADQNMKPTVQSNASVKEIISEISKKRLGACAVVKDEKIIGVITDGDIRRMLENTTDLSLIIAADIMSKNPKTIDASVLAVATVDVFRDNKISQLIVTDKDKYIGMIHIHDLNREGII